MNEEELDALLAELEAALQEDVQAALTLTANDFARAVEGATELTAAAFSVSRIGRMWQRRVSGIMAQLRRIAGLGARETADALDEPTPSNESLAPALDPYMEATRQLLDDVGDRLANQAVTSLAEGVAAGESLDELKTRMLVLFNDEGSQLGPTRAQRIASTEATRAWNAGTLAAAQALTGPERPLVKQWQTRRDERVRPSHREADGQLRLLDEPFDVGGYSMQYPGDPAAPADETIECRCILRTEAAPTDRTASMAEDGNDGQDFQSGMPEQLKDYWLNGEGAGRIRWGTPGSFDRCVRELRDDVPVGTEGVCANLYHEATGRWPGQNKSGGEVHTGAMIALIPSASDAARLVIEGGEDVDQLHVTLAFLGEAADWSEADQQYVKGYVQQTAGYFGPVSARAFGVAHWNPQGDNPVWVYSVGDAEGGPNLGDVHREIGWVLDDTPHDVPRQHSPWVPHVTGAYSSDRADQDAMLDRLGDITFDRIRVAFGGEYDDIYLTAPDPDEGEVAESPVNPTMLATWTTPGDAALAFENVQTGDGRVFAPGALYWDRGPWPLQYADEMMGGHDGARLAGAIDRIAREGERIPGEGVLYLTQDAGREAAMLLAQGAPLGVSVDLDDVDLEFVSAEPGGAEVYRARMLRASVLPVDDGGYVLAGEMMQDMSVAASGTSTMLSATHMSFLVDADGTVPAEALRLTAAAGDPDMAGEVIDTQRSGEYLMRITRGRIRGATLVTIPAYAGARIVLDNPSMFASAPIEDMDEATAAIKATTDYDRVLRHVRSSKVPVGAARLAQFLKMPVSAAQRLLAVAASRGEVVRLTRGLYTDKTTSAKADHVMMDDLTASVTGAIDLPVADRDAEWDGDAAATRVFAWADGDTSKLDRAFAYRDDDADPQTKASRKLGYADVLDGRLVIIPAGVSAAIGAVNGARGGVDIPADQLDDVRDHLEEVRAHVSEATSDDEMQASAWTAMQSLPPMPAEWFREPTAEELPPGGPGVNYSNGRIFGWVAQAGEPHAGFAKKITIDTLGKIDTTHFLRQHFNLDDGTTVRAGAYTMNVGHHRDGAECETSSCQFDDTRTVAGVVTVGMNDRGMWFSGAAAPWLSEWDRAVFAATQPSYHMKKSPGGGWQLRAVLGVPVPGHSSPLLATAVIERAQVALTAAATMAEVDAAIAAEEERQQEEAVATIDVTASIDYDRLADAIVAASARAEQRAADEAAEVAELLAMAEGITASADKLDGETTGTEGD